MCGDFCGEFVGLLVCEVAALCVASAGGFDVGARIFGDDVIFVSCCEDLSEYA